MIKLCTGFKKNVDKNMPKTLFKIYKLKFENDQKRSFLYMKHDQYCVNVVFILMCFFFRKGKSNYVKNSKTCLSTPSNRYLYEFLCREIFINDANPTLSLYQPNFIINNLECFGSIIFKPFSNLSNLAYKNPWQKYVIQFSIPIKY